MTKADITTVRDAPDLAIVQVLFQEYGEALRDDPASASYFTFAAFEAEMRTLPAPYTGLLLATVAGVAAGCVAYRVEAAEPTCEIKRLYVRPAFRGDGLARRLMAEAIAQAAGHGCERVILDTIMLDAEALYRSLGFREYKPRNGRLTFMEYVLPTSPRQAQAATSSAR